MVHSRRNRDLGIKIVLIYELHYGNFGLGIFWNTAMEI